MSPWLNLSELALELGVSPSTTLRLVQEGRCLSATRIAGQWRIPRSLLPLLLGHVQTVPPEPHPSKPTLSIPECAAWWAVSTRTVYRMIGAGVLPVVRVRSAPRVRRADIIHYQAAARTAAEEEHGWPTSA